MSTKRIIEDKDFCRIVIATRRGARNITMRVKPDGLYLTVPPYSKTDKVLSTLEQFRADLRERFRQVAVRPIDFSFRIEADCFRLSLSPSHLKCFTVRQMPSGEVTVFCPEHTDFSDEAVQKLVRGAILRAMKKMAAEFLPPFITRMGRTFRVDLPKSTDYRCPFTMGKLYFGQDHQFVLLPDVSSLSLD